MKQKKERLKGLRLERRYLLREPRETGKLTGERHRQTEMEEFNAGERAAERRRRHLFIRLSSSFSFFPPHFPDCETLSIGQP